MATNNLSHKAANKGCDDKSCDHLKDEYHNHNYSILTELNGVLKS